MMSKILSMKSQLGDKFEMKNLGSAQKILRGRDSHGLSPWRN